jgi:hypothetical protein
MVMCCAVSIEHRLTYDILCAVSVIPPCCVDLAIDAQTHTHTLLARESKSPSPSFLTVDRSLDSGSFFPFPFFLYSSVRGGNSGGFAEGHSRMDLN